MNVIKVDPNNLPTCEVLAYSEGYIFTGNLIRGTQNVKCETETEYLDDVTHYILASDLVNLFKLAQDGNLKD